MDEKRSTKNKLIDIITSVTKRIDGKMQYNCDAEILADALIESGLMVDDNKLLVCPNCGIESVYNHCPRCGYKLKE